jgi:hypothetical protein
VAVIVLSLAGPAAGLAGPIGVGLCVVAIASLLVGRSRGRPPRRTTRRLSGYVVRPDVVAVPEAVLFGFAVAELVTAELSEASETMTLCTIGAAVGIAWVLIGRWLGDHVRGGVKVVVGLLALAKGVSVLMSGDGCLPPVPTRTLLWMGIVLTASVGLALFVGVTQRAVILPSRVGAYAMATIGLLELVKLAAVPAGVDVVGGFTVWTTMVVMVGFAAAAFLAAINPRLAEAVIGVSLAAASAYLVLFDVRLGGATGGACDSFGRAVWVVAPVVLVSVLAGGDRRARQ